MSIHFTLYAVLLFTKWMTPSHIDVSMKWICALLLSSLSLGFSQSENDSDQFTLGIPTIPDPPNRLEIYQEKGWVEFNAKTGKLEYRESFQLKSDTGLELLSRDAIMDLNTRNIELLGDVRIFQSGLYQRGNRAIYNYASKEIINDGLKVSLSPILLEAGSFKTTQKNGKTYFLGKNAGITTHDVEKPNFWIRADRIKVYPDEKITFKNLKLYAGETPIFWLPIFAQPLDAELGYHFIPGAKSNWGGYLLNRYGVMLGEDKDSIFYQNGQPWLLAQYLVDIRTRRGLGLGADFKDIRLNDNPNLTGLKFYYLNDLDPQITRSGIVRPRVNEDRYRIELKHRHYFHRDSEKETYLDGNLVWLSDQFYREDFEPKLFRYDPDPDNTVSLLHKTPYLLGGLTSRLRINDFYQSDTKLPEVFFDFIKSPIADSPLLYEGHASIGKYKEFLASANRSDLQNELTTLLPGDPRISEINTLLDERGYQRFHTYHEFSLPLQPRRGISIVPHAGAGYTRYWSIDNGTSGFDRTHLQAGVDFSLKFAKRFEGISNKKWGIDGLMHVIQPYASFSYLKTDALDPSFRSIQRLTPSTEIRPIKVGRFSAIDDLNTWSVLRVGLRNNLITKRDGGSHPWLTMNSYIDLFFDDPEFDRDFSNLYNDLTWHPLPWVKLDLHTQLPIGNEREGFSEFATTATFMPRKDTELSVGYRYLDSHPTLEDSTRIDIRAYTRFNEKWGGSFYQRWELDDGTLEAQQYSIHRDLGSWTASLGFLRRDNRIKNETGVLLSFTLKEFPSISLPFSIDTE